MDFFKKNGKGLAICLLIAVPSWFLGKAFPIVGGAVIAILAGMIVTLFFKEKGGFESGIKFTSKKILQWAVILLGFGLNLNVILETGKQSLPIIVCTIATSLIIAYLLHRLMRIPSNISTLVGVGSSICGGSAIAATAPVRGHALYLNAELGNSFSLVYQLSALSSALKDESPSAAGGLFSQDIRGVYRPQFLVAVQHDAERNLRGSISTVISSSISGITSTAAKEVCLFPAELNGEIRTRRWTPFSFFRYP